LTFPDYSDEAAPLELYTDASGVGVGACLVQKQQGILKPIAFVSMTFNSAQRNYNTLERELAAIRWGVKTLRAFLFGVFFLIHTDHQPLVYLNNMKIVNVRLARTHEDLADFFYLICYTPGAQNGAADMLSRMDKGDGGHVVDPGCYGRLPKGISLDVTVPGGEILSLSA
jgi:hypothetical protein